MRFTTCMLIHQFMTLNYESLWTPKRENHVTKQNHGVSPRARTGNVLAKDPARVRNLWGCHFHTTSAASWKPRSETPFFQDTKTRINTHQYASIRQGRNSGVHNSFPHRWWLGKSWQILADLGDSRETVETAFVLSGTAPPPDVASLALMGYWYIFFL